VICSKRFVTGVLFDFKNPGIVSQIVYPDRGYACVIPSSPPTVAFVPGTIFFPPSTSSIEKAALYEEAPQGAKSFHSLPIRCEWFFNPSKL